MKILILIADFAHKFYRVWFNKVSLQDRSYYMYYNYFSITQL